MRRGPTTRSAIARRSGSAAATYNYTYYKNGANPRLRNDGSGVSDYTYDTNGNVTATPSMPRQGQDPLVWDYANRLTSLAGTTYAYDYLRRRKSATAGP